MKQFEKDKIYALTINLGENDEPTKYKSFIKVVDKTNKTISINYLGHKVCGSRKDLWSNFIEDGNTTVNYDLSYNSEYNCEAIDNTSFYVSGMQYIPDSEYVWVKRKLDNGIDERMAEIIVRNWKQYIKEPKTQEDNDINKSLVQGFIKYNATDEIDYSQKLAAEFLEYLPADIEI